MATSYRWNSSTAAESYDAGAPAIHPFYVAVQDEILRLLAAHAVAAGRGPACVVDLGGGSGRLIERVLEQFPHAHGVVMDQSTAFLGIAERRLAKFGARASFVERRLQDDWAATFPQQPDVLVSTSAIHHLEPHEKQAVYQRCFDALAPGGIFINGDEFRPKSDEDFLACLNWWWQQKDVEMAAGRIPESFGPLFDAWYERNITQFGQPKKSGDDCLETAAVQVDYLREAGFRDVELPWNEQLWGVLVGRR
jgi:SAM-dependent methyltransferase